MMKSNSIFYPFDYKFEKDDRKYTTNILYKASFLVLIFIILPILPVLILMQYGMSIIVTLYIYYMILFGLIFSDMYKKYRLVLMKKEDAIQVSENDYPKILEIVNSAAVKLSLETPKVLIYKSSDIDASNLLLKKHGFIMISSGCINLLNEKELSFVIGHELTHMKYHKTKGLIKGIITNFYNPWYVEYIADFGGLEVNNSLNDSISALMKIGLGSDIRENNIKDNKVIIDRDIGHLSKIILTHPPIRSRVIQIKKYWRKKEQQDLKPIIPAK